MHLRDTNKAIIYLESEKYDQQNLKFQFFFTILKPYAERNQTPLAREMLFFCKFALQIQTSCTSLGSIHNYDKPLNQAIVM